jgi:hypothetical protein
MERSSLCEVERVILLLELGKGELESVTHMCIRARPWDIRKIEMGWMS